MISDKKHWVLLKLVEELEAKNIPIPSYIYHAIVDDNDVSHLIKDLEYILKLVEAKGDSSILQMKYELNGWRNKYFEGVKELRAAQRQIKDLRERNFQLTAKMQKERNKMADDLRLARLELKNCMEEGG
jgi:succinate dehydrogenase/fumarate reductase flavoprotein subunit